MTEHYVTLFDHGFLANGVAMHASMMRHAGDFTLWILCLDATTEEALSRLELPNVRTIPLREAETDELLSVKGGRTRAEYCWTLTSFTPDLVFERDPAVERVTYVDADMWLAASPQPVFDEFDRAGAAVLLTEHAYSPEFEQSVEYGIYCVQFMPFAREASRHVRRWWQDRVVEWCYARSEDGKFGDQKYLDDWPERFGEAAHVLSHREWTQAPWNATRFSAQDAVTYHFHRLRTRSDHSALVGLYRLPPDHVARIYRPYLADLRDAFEVLAAVGFTPPTQSPSPGGWLAFKDWLAFRMHNWPDVRAPYALRF